MKLTKEDCLSCGACCFFGKYNAGKKWEGLEVGENGWCIHHDKEKKCTIHEERPQVCRDFDIGCEECVNTYMQNLQGVFDSK